MENEREYTREEELEAQLAMQNKTIAMWSEMIPIMIKTTAEYAAKLIKDRDAEMWKAIFDESFQQKRKDQNDAFDKIMEAALVKR